MEPDFNNTEIAFKLKSNAELKGAFWLFKIISIPWVVKLGQRLLSFALFLKLPIKGIVKATIFKQFIGGENLVECEKVVEELYDKCKVGSILDYSAEGNSSEADFEKCKSRIIETVVLAKRIEAIPFSVFKVTGIARFELLEKIQNKLKLTEEETKEWERVKFRAHEICQAAYDSSTPIFIDGEETWIQNTIDLLAEELMEKYNTIEAVVFNTVQMYRKDRYDYLKQANFNSLKNNYYLGVKIVRGAYLEKENERAILLNYESPIHPYKHLTDKHFNDALKYCVENHTSIDFCAGTHNEESCLYLIKLMKEHHIANSCHTIYFAQLLGMSDHITFNLIKHNYNVAKYVPFGPVKKVIPYLTRRANENTSIQGQTTRELNLIRLEIARRKSNL